MVLTGEEAKKFSEEIRKEEAKKAFESLLREKNRAKEQGKEEFSYEKLRSLVDPSYYAGGKTLEEQIKNLEYKYYVEKTSIKSIEEFSRHIIEIYKWAD
jgi:polyhydroxyalkanoate synthesis regulator phasin